MITTATITAKPPALLWRKADTNFSTSPVWRQGGLMLMTNTRGTNNGNQRSHTSQAGRRDCIDAYDSL